MGLRSKKSQQLLQARNKALEANRSKREEQEKTELWKEKQDSTPDAMMMVSTRNMQNIVNQLSCKDCNQTGEIVFII